MTLTPGSAGSRRTSLLVSLAGVVGAVAGAGCSSTPSYNHPPEQSWVGSLGAGVTVISPRSDAAGNNYSPGAVIHSYIDELNAGRFSVLCSLVEPAAQPSCTKAVAGATSNGAKFTNFKLGYMAIKGDQALVGVTGTNCNPTQKPTCTTNSDPAALFSSGASFATLFRQGLASQNPSDTTNSYSLAPCLQVNGKWYLDIPPSDF